MELKVLILDDEYIILDGLCSFPWDTYGCTVIGSAGDGDEGLALAREHQPDIILSDIKMPGMDGLAFSNIIKAEFPDTEIILLTGYDNFSFAQKALRIGVCEYLLKPVDFKEMHAVIEKVCSQIRERRRHKKDYSELRRKYQQSLPLIRSKLIADLIHGRMKDHRDMEMRMKMLNIRIERYVLVYGRLQNEEIRQTVDLEPGLLDFVVCNVCEEFLRGAGIQVYTETDTLGYCFVVVFPKNVDDRDCITHCVQACEQIQDKFSEVLPTEISFGISPGSTDPYSMNRAYKQAEEACEQSVYMGAGPNLMQYQDIADIQIATWNITDGERKRLFSEITRGNIETAKGVVDQIFADCEELEAMQYAAMELLISCFQYVGQESVRFRSDIEKNTLLADSMNRIYSCRTRKDVLVLLKKGLTVLADQNRGVQINRNERTAQGILNYIENHYSEDLSLDFLAEHFKISKTYINRLLKNHTGKSFLEILLDCRMVQAEQLICEGRYKIFEIAEMAGYHDLSYFIKAFKKKYGVTPNVYKRL